MIDINVLDENFDFMNNLGHIDFNVIRDLLDIYKDDLKIIHTIDEYGETVLNRLQVDLLISDINFLISMNESLENYFDRLMDACRRLKSSSHEYLNLSGD